MEAIDLTPKLDPNCKHEMQKAQWGVPLLSPTSNPKIIKAEQPISDKCKKCGGRDNYETSTYEIEI